MIKTNTSYSSPERQKVLYMGRNYAEKTVKSILTTHARSRPSPCTASNLQNMKF